MVEKKNKHRMQRERVFNLKAEMLKPARLVFTNKD